MRTRTEQPTRLLQGAKKVKSKLGVFKVGSVSFLSFTINIVQLTFSQPQKIAYETIFPLLIAVADRISFIYYNIRGKKREKIKIRLASAQINF